MKIIKEGVRYQGTCPNCACVFQATKGETEDSVLIGVPTRSAKCPECRMSTKVEPVAKDGALTVSYT